MSTDNGSNPSYNVQRSKLVLRQFSTQLPLSDRSIRSYLISQPSSGLLATIASLIIIYMLVQITDELWLIEFTNMVGPLILGLTVSLTCFRLVRRQQLAIWTPYASFLGGILLFYSLGPLVYVLGSYEVQAYMNSALPIKVTTTDLLRTNLLNAVGIFSILAGMRLTRAIWIGPKCTGLIKGGSIRRVKALTFLFLAIGGALQYFLILPIEFGIYGFILPGVIYNLGKLFLFGLFGLAYLVSRGVKTWKWLLYSLWFLQILVSMLHFSKTDLILSLLLPVLGFYLADRNSKRLLLSGLIMVIAYVSVAHLIHYGRQEVYKLSGNITQATFSQRLEIIGRWFSGEAQTYKFFRPDLSQSETGWARLSYSNVQTFAMNRYDSGMPGETLKTVMIVLIPRVIWPEKPITTDMAKDFYKLVTGWRGESHLGLGLFGEGYWNFGWFGVVLLGVVTGVIFWVLSGFAVNWMRAGAIEYMPSIFIAINMGILGTTGLFANAIIGATGLIAIYALFVSKVLVAMTVKSK